MTFSQTALEITTEHNESGTILINLCLRPVFFFLQLGTHPSGLSCLLEMLMIFLRMGKLIVRPVKYLILKKKF